MENVLLMGKFIGFMVLVFLGLFVIVVFNNKQMQNKQTSQNIDLNDFSKPTSLPSPTPIAVDANNPSTSTSAQTITNNVIIKTSKGDIELALYDKDAPNTVANFISKAKSGFYNNLTFHRVEDWVIQGGDPMRNGTGGDKMATELNNKPFVVGSLGVARGADIKVSNDAQFFITKKDSQFLNGQYTNFGIVVKGMDVVSKIQIGDKILGITLQ